MLNRLGVSKTSPRPSRGGSNDAIGAQTCTEGRLKFLVHERFSHQSCLTVQIFTVRKINIQNIQGPASLYLGTRSF